ncbi:hypothetical protein L596_030655 [Steinernema carpocapsae]|uniref:Protein tweety homolog n=1 Tax=Steinernema carpocapsae TaxID=34508 RepID=A0A4U5LQ30_STECR|nr:hypothetical protein L596_030655 [Steinernema carpocapsae]
MRSLQAVFAFLLLSVVQVSCSSSFFEDYKTAVIIIGCVVGLVILICMSLCIAFGCWRAFRTPLPTNDASCGGVASLRCAAAIRGRGMPRMVRSGAASCGSFASLRCAAANNVLRGCVERMRRRVKAFVATLALNHCVAGRTGQKYNYFGTERVRNNENYRIRTNKAFL